MDPGHGSVRPMPAHGRAGHGDGDEERFGLLVDEFNHRLRNLLTMVEAVVSRTQAADIEEFRAAVMARIAGLRSVQELIGEPDGRAVHLADLVEQTLAPYGATNEARVQAVGPAVDLRSDLALALHLVLHELATNAAKHGALGAPAGWVKIRWDVLRSSGPGRRLAMVWSEHGGPDVKTPQRQGFGTRLITRALTRATPGHVELTFKPSGLVCRIVVELDRPLALPSRSRNDDADPDRLSSLN